MSVSEQEIRLGILGLGFATGTLAAIRWRTTAAALVHRARKMTTTIFAYCTVAAFGALIELGGAPTSQTQYESLLTVFAVITLLWFGVWLLNDIFDKETDEKANPERPLARGVVTERAMYAGAVWNLAFALLLSATVGPYAFAVAIFFIGVNVAYSVPPIRLKRYAWPSMLSNGVLLPAAGLLGSAAIVTSPSSFTLTVALVGTIMMTINISYWDFKDAEDDARSDAETFVTKYGRERVRRALTVAMPASYITFALLFGIVKLLPVFVVFAIAAIHLLRTRTDRYHRLAYEIDMLNGCFFVVLGAVYAIS